MNGMAAGRELFQRLGRPMLERRFPGCVERVAAGLVGEGSECFGYDDNLSRDHDWEPGFCLWLNDADYAVHGAAMHSAYENEVIASKMKSAPGDESPSRRGVFATGAFYSRFLNRDTPPQSNADWLKLPEEYLAVCSNGEVFVDSLGEFSTFRKRLLEFYPRDVWLKKIAARCLSLAQDGQYNYPRCRQRGETVAANHALARFIHAACSLVHLMHHRYKPFYKWMHRSLLELPAPGPEVGDHLASLAGAGSDEEEIQFRKQRDRIETVAEILALAMRKQGICDSSSTFLLKHAVVVQDRITDPAVRRLPLGTG
jgi:hypothetical protein